MNPSRDTLAKSLDVAANIGIVVGLLLVALQIAQQDEITDIDIQGQTFSEAIDHYDVLAGEDPAAALARAIDDPQHISTYDHVVLHNLYMAEFAKALRLEALEGYTLSASSVRRWQGLLGNPYGYAWWQIMGPRIADLIPQHYSAINAALLDAGPAHANAFKNVSDAIDEALRQIP